MQNKMLQDIGREMLRGQSELKTIQFDIKKCPQENQPSLIEQFNEMRSLIGELDLVFSQKKKALKFDIQLVDEREQLEKMDEKIDIVVDDGEVDEIDGKLEDLRPGRKNLADGSGNATPMPGASLADTEFAKRFQSLKEIEKQTKARVSLKSLLILADSDI